MDAYGITRGLINLSEPPPPFHPSNSIPALKDRAIDNSKTRLKRQTLIRVC